MGLLDDVLMRTRKPFLDIDELRQGKTPLPDGYNFSKMNTNAAPSPTNFDFGEISGGGTRPETPRDPIQWSQSGRIQNRLPEWQEVAEGKSDALASARGLGATRTTPTTTPEPSPAPSPAPSRPMRPPMDFARNSIPEPPTRPAGLGGPPAPPIRPAGLGGPPLPPSRQLALGEPNLPRVPDVPPPSIPRTALAPPPEIASTRAAADSMPPAPPVKAPMNRSLSMNEIPPGYGYWDDGTVRNAQGQSAPIYGPSRGEAASDILSKINPAAGATSLPRIGNVAKATNFLDSTAVKPAIETGILGPTAPALGTAIPQAAAAPAIVGPPVGSAIPGAKDKDEDSAMPGFTDADFAPDGDSGGDSMAGLTDADFAGGDAMGGMLGGMGGGMGAMGGLLGMMGSLMGGGKKDSGFDPPPKAPSVPPPGAASQPEMQRAASEKQAAQQILSGILAGNQHSLLDRRRPYA